MMEISRNARHGAGTKCHCCLLQLCSLQTESHCLGKQRGIKMQREHGKNHTLSQNSKGTLLDSLSPRTTSLPTTQSLHCRSGTVLGDGFQHRSACPLLQFQGGKLDCLCLPLKVSLHQTKQGLLNFYTPSAAAGPLYETHSQAFTPEAWCKTVM